MHTWHSKDLIWVNYGYGQLWLTKVISMMNLKVQGKDTVSSTMKNDINLRPQVLQMDPKLSDGVLVVNHDNLVDEIVSMIQQLKQFEDGREDPKTITIALEAHLVQLFG